MTGQKKKSGGARKIGRNEAKCRRYYDKMTRYHNKLKHWLKSNVKRTATENEKQKKIIEFKEIQDRRKKNNA